MSGSADTYRAGVFAELIAGFYLLCKGYRLIGWRRKTPVGEIDIIAARGSVIVFTEVKWRKEGDAALGAVSQKSQGRIVRAAQYALAARPDWQGRDLRFDLIAISPPFFIRHIDNAWRPLA